MREEHPIDERFKALYDVEVDPPDQVREAVARHLDQASAPKPTNFWRAWPLFIAGAALLATSTYLFWGVFERGLPTSQTAAVPRFNVDRTAVYPVSRTSVHSDYYSGATGSVTLPQPDSITNKTIGTRPEGSFDQVPTSVVTVAHTRPPQQRAHSPSTRTTPGFEQVSVTQLRRGAAPMAMAPPPQASSISGTVDGEWGLPTRATDQPPVSLATPWEGDPNNIYDVRAIHPSGTTRMAILLPASRDVAAGPPLGTPLLPHYVLAPAQWWLGIYASVGQLKGDWRGPLGAELNPTERWRESTECGVELGRRWQTGWSWNTGIGLSRQSSTFTHNTRPLERFANLDTSWTQTMYNDGQNVIYTWSIDTIITERPGAEQLIRARNHYTSLRVPITLAWHGLVRRWHYGALGGLALWLPTQREGYTLRRTTDNNPNVVPLTDMALENRFGPRLNAHIGLSLGYSIHETLSVYAEPQFTMPISAFGQPDALWTQGPLIQIRLQHELGSR